MFLLSFQLNHLTFALINEETGKLKKFNSRASAFDYADKHKLLNIQVIDLEDYED